MESTFRSYISAEFNKTKRLKPESLLELHLKKFSQLVHCILLSFPFGRKTCGQLVIIFLHLASFFSEIYEKMIAEFLSLILPHIKYVPTTEQEVSKSNRSWWESLAKIFPVKLCQNSVSEFLGIKDGQFDMMRSQTGSLTYDDKVVSELAIAAL